MFRDFVNAPTLNPVFLLLHRRLARPTDQKRAFVRDDELVDTAQGADNHTMVQPLKPLFLFLTLTVTSALPSLSGSQTARAAVVPAYDVRTERTWNAPSIMETSGWWSNGQSLPGGTARLQGVLGRKAEVSVLVRGALEKATPTQGYQVRIARGKLHLERIDGSKVTPITEPEDISRPGRGELELLVTHVGPYILARLYRVKNARHLGTVFARDSAYSRGVSAVHMGTSSRAKLKIDHFATRPACKGTPVHAGERGRTLWATMTEEKASTLKGIKLRPMETVSRSPRRAVYRFDSIDLERAVCQGASLDTLTSETPWKYLDPTYRKGRHARWKRDVRVDLEASYKNPKMVRTLLKRWAKEFPERTYLETLGKSRQGRPILALAIGDRPTPAGDAPTLLLNGAHHGNEPISTEFVLDAADELLYAPRGGTLDTWLKSRTVWIVPVVNPDGLHAFLEVTARTGRKNGHDHDHDGTRERLEGIDLNRNYPFRWGALGEKGSRSRPSSVYYRGVSPASEPEVKAMMALASRERFAASISYHTGTVAILAPYTIPGVENPEVNEAWSVAEEMVRAMPTHAQDRTFALKKNLYPVDGTDQDWHRYAHGTVALLVEGARRTPRRTRDRVQVLQSVAPAWRFLLRRFTEGPLLDIRVTDPEGRAVNAEVVVHPMEPKSGEIWPTRCPSGRTLRAVPSSGSWTVEVKRAGMPSVLQTVEVRQAPVPVHVVVEDARPLDLCKEREPQGSALPPE